MLKAVYIEMPPSHPLAWPAGRQRPKAGDGGCVCVGGWVHYITPIPTQPPPQHLHVRACVVRKSIAYGAQARTANSNVFILHIKPTAAAELTHPLLFTHTLTDTHRYSQDEGAALYICVFAEDF